MYTSTTRFTGLSGIDTESMVKQLMQAESAKLYRYQRTTQTYQWKQEAYRNTVKDLSSFKTDYLNLGSSKKLNFRSPTTFSNTSSSVTNKSGGGTSNAVKVVGGTTKEVDLELQIEQLATKELFESKTADGSLKTGDISGFVPATYSDEKIKFSYDGVTKEITLDGTFNDADELQAHLQTELDNAFGSGKVTVSKDGDALSFGTNKGNTLSITNPDTNTSESWLKGGSTGISGSKTMGDLFGSADGSDIEINGTKIDFDSDTTLDEFINTINKSDAGVKASYDKVTGKISMESKIEGEIGKINLGGSNLSDIFGSGTPSAKVEAKDAIIKYKGETITKNSNNIELNGVKLQLMETTGTGTTDGVKISTKNDVDKTVSNVKEFVDSYNEMIEKLNNMVKTKKSKTNTGGYYTPLTDDEKKAMKKEDIDKWEEEAKKGILYNDDIVKELQTELRTMVYKPVKLSDGSELSLHQLGITTTINYNDGGKLEVDEDKLKSAIAEHGDKIGEMFTKSASAENWSDYGAKLNDEGVSERINSIIDKATKSTGRIAKRAGLENTISATDNDLYNKIKDQQSKMSDLMRNLARKEENYFKMFSKLESAMMKSDSQANYLSQFFGA